MSNPITGDFPAVLQVSGGTINRLLATMHQNAFADAERPSFPHSVTMRIGDPEPVDGARGTVQAQIGVPTIGLIAGATDRFMLEVGVRAWFRPDYGSDPLPAFVHGTVSAEYRVHDIDPSCAGWGRLAADYLWIRVVRDSVRFAGTAADDESPMTVSGVLGSGVGAAAQQARITRVIAALLATRFEAAPHKLSSDRFKRGRMRSLVAPGAESAVALPLAANGGPPAGDIASITNLLLEGSDFAIGVTRDQIMAIAEPALAAITAPYPSVPVDEMGINTVYRVTVDPPLVEWQPKGSSAVISVKVHGAARTDSILADATFDVYQEIVLNFAPDELWLSGGYRSVKVRASGLGSGEVANRVKDNVNATVDKFVGSACNAAAPKLAAMIARKNDLIDQLKTLDGAADASLDAAEFSMNGMILRGTVYLTSRRRPVVVSSRTAQDDGYTALDSWIPGGRIDKFEWTWNWVGQRPKGAAAHDDRFVLRRPAGAVSRWGMVQASTPLPGLDGQGTVCLRVRGVQVDPITGQLVPVESVRRCLRYVLDVVSGIRGAQERLFLRDVPELSQDVTFPELAVVDTRGRRAATNTLLLYAHRAWDREAAHSVHAALNHTRRRDAGLTLLVLLPEEVLRSAGPNVLAEIEEFATAAGIPHVVNEDVGGSWARTFALKNREAFSFRLLSPHGGVTWKWDGRLDPERLSQALDNCLVRSAPARSRVLYSGPQEGVQLRAESLAQGIRGLVESRCPPLPLGRLRDKGAVITFVQRGSAASEHRMRELAARFAEPDGDIPVVVAVIDGADEHQVEALKNQLGFDFAAIADTSGAIADRFGVRIWPTTVEVDGRGVVSGVDAGSSRGPSETGKRGHHPARRD
jgi:hypothetical protein